MSNEILEEKVKKIFEKLGTSAYKFARKEILNERIGSKSLQDALLYFFEELQYNVHHPTLLSLACQAVDGKGKKTTEIGAALVLLTGAAHLHDDVIDRTKTKESKPTVFGKFGADMTILLGDIILFKGLHILYEACESLPEKQGKAIIDLVKKAFFEISTAEAKETDLKGNWNVAPEECLLLLERKAAVPELATRIGAILGEGSTNEIEALGKYGRIFGLLLAVREEFINVFEPEELMDRAKNQILPLPILYLLHNPKEREKVKKLFRRKLTESDALKIVSYVRKTKEMLELMENIQRLSKEGQDAIRNIKNNNIANVLTMILQAMTADLDV